jgi:hypothetical protein
VKGSQKNIQPKIAENVDRYKSRQRISTSSNIQSGFAINSKSERVMQKTEKKLLEDIDYIND